MKKQPKNPNRVSITETIGFLAANVGNLPLMALLSSFFMIF